MPKKRFKLNRLSSTKEGLRVYLLSFSFVLNTGGSDYVHHKNMWDAMNEGETIAVRLDMFGKFLVGFMLEDGTGVEIVRVTPYTVKLSCTPRVKRRHVRRLVREFCNDVYPVA